MGSSSCNVANLTSFQRSSIPSSRAEYILRSHLRSLPVPPYALPSVDTAPSYGQQNGIPGVWRLVIQGMCRYRFTFATVDSKKSRFQVVVLSAYKQIRAQNVDVLSDISEDNYDRAFAFLRPSEPLPSRLSRSSLIYHHSVIQGASDMGSRLSESELQKSLDFCVNLFNPTSPEHHERLSRSGRISKELLDVTAPVMDPAMLESTLRVGHKNISAKPADSELSSDSEAITEMRMVLRKINARRVVHSEYAINNFEMEPLDGYAVRLERGKLGLFRASQS